MRKRRLQNYKIICKYRNLAGKNLPAAIEDISGDQVPDSIKEKSQQIREQGGLQMLEERMFSLPELLERNREILDEVSLSKLLVYVCLLCIIDPENA